MKRHVNFSGLAIAGLGFFLTRFTVTLTVYTDPRQFYLAGVIPLALGLGLSAFGIALTVADVDPVVVRRTAIWSCIGAGTMAILVILTLAGADPESFLDLSVVRSRTFLSNVLIGGSIGGTLTGLYASRNYQQRVSLRQQTNRLSVLNRLLRHEVLNAVTIIQGYNDLQTADAREAITEETETIVRSIEQVKHLSGTGVDDDPGSIPVSEPLEATLSDIESTHQTVTIERSRPDEAISVRGDHRLREVFFNLLDNAVTHAGEDPSVGVEVTSTDRDVRIAITDDGPGLPESQQRLLERGDINEFDDPTTGFGLNVVRILVEEFDGHIETSVTETGTTVAVVLRRTDVQGAFEGSQLVGVRPSGLHLGVTLVAALIAGVTFGLVAIAFDGSVGIIGVYYGVADPIVGWIAHEFHSVVFGFVYAGLVSLMPANHRDQLWSYLVVGLGWALVLWLFAAGLVSPVWLRLIGIDAPIPTIDLMRFATHVVWGITLALVTWIGYRSVVPRLQGILRNR